MHLKESRPGRDYNYPSSGSKGYGGRGSHHRDRHYGGKDSFRKVAYIAGLDDVESDKEHGGDDVHLDANEEARDYDDEVDDETLANELNLLADI